MNENSSPEDTKRPATIEHAPPLVANAHDLVPAQSGAGLPALPSTIQRPSRRRWLRVALALAVLAVGAGGAYYWWQRLHPPLPPGIAFGNGRLEADEINIDTKYAGRIAEMLADEGDLVAAGQVVARMDTQRPRGLAEKIASPGPSRRKERSTKRTPTSPSRKRRWCWRNRNSIAPSPC